MLTHLPLWDEALGWHLVVMRKLAVRVQGLGYLHLFSNTA
jgi:hypothetical protein